MGPDDRLRGAMEPAWNDLREQRLLGRIAEGRRRRRTARRLPVLAAMAVTVCCIAFASWRVATRTGPWSSFAAAPAPALDHPSRLTLADGSEAILGPDGNVQVDEQAPTRVRLRQGAGAARYVVRPDPAREFVVLAEGVTVRVRGTIFSVTIGPASVGVSVERGRVEVSGGTRTRDLVAGETFMLPSHPSDDVADASSGVAQAGPRSPSPGVSAPAGTTITSTAAPSAAALLARADEARAAGNLAEAAQALETFASTYARDARLPAALFTLGRVERARGRPESAASAFERCASAMPRGPLADDALAEAAQSWNAAGAAERARADANAYLIAHPGGIHATAMQAIAAK